MESKEAGVESSQCPGEGTSGIGGPPTGNFLMPRHFLVPYSHCPSLNVLRQCLLSGEVVGTDGSAEESALRGGTPERAGCKVSCQGSVRPSTCPR